MVPRVAFSPDRKRLVTAYDNGTVTIWDVAKGRCLATLCGHADVVTHVAFSRDGKRLVTTSRDGTVKIWDAEHWDVDEHTGLCFGRCLATLRGHTHPVLHVAFSPDEKRLVTTSWDGTAKIWDAEHWDVDEHTGLCFGRCLVTLRGHTHAVLHVAFSPDGTFFATVSCDGTVKLWCLKESPTLPDSLRGEIEKIRRIIYPSLVTAPASLT
ncbi:MAG: WD40 repeat domain-containing protein [Verrucomicrobia bacterium]|nr:WD40 repeat domain-containing protein [Verrucomicrobiota bacterium]